MTPWNCVRFVVPRLRQAGGYWSVAGDMDDDARGTQGVSAGGDAFIAGDMLVLEAPAQSLLPLSAAVRNPGPVFAAARIEEFTGRMWLSAQIDDFMARHPRGYIFVEAEAGVGKTAFAAWLVKTRDYLSHSLATPWATRPGRRRRTCPRS